MNPNVYSEHVKPLELNLTVSHSSGSRQLHTSRNPDLYQPPAMPFLFYHAPYAYFPQKPWTTNLNPVPSTSQPVGLHQNPSGRPKLVKGPAISAWLQYCDNHPDHAGNNLVTLATNFKTQGYRTIDQLTSRRISIKNLSSWMNIGKGTADYIIQYADEDMVLVNNGEFKMVDVPNVGGSGDDLL